MSIDTASVAPGWYADPAGTAAWRYWDGTGWTEDRRPFPAPEAAPTRNGWATAGLVLGIIAPLLDPAFIPTVLAVVFGALGVAAAERLGGLGRRKAIAAIVLGLVAIPAQVGLLLLLTHATSHTACGCHATPTAASITSGLQREVADGGVTLQTLSCPPAAPITAGSTFVCIGTATTGQRWAFDVTMLAGGGWTWKSQPVV